MRQSISISGSGSQPSGLFSTALSTGNAGQITVSTPTLTMADSATISVATSGSGNAGNISLNVSNLSTNRWSSGREQHDRSRSRWKCDSHSGQLHLHFRQWKRASGLFSTAERQGVQARSP